MDKEESTSSNQEESKSRELPKVVKDIVKKKRRLTDVTHPFMDLDDYMNEGNEFMNVDGYMDTFRYSNVAENKKNERKRRSVTEELTEKEKEEWANKMELIKRREDVLASISVILSFLNTHEDIKAAMNTEQLKVNLVDLRYCIEEKNKEDDAHQKKITEFFH